MRANNSLRESWGYITLLKDNSHFLIYFYYFSLTLISSFLPVLNALNVLNMLHQILGRVAEYKEENKDSSCRNRICTTRSCYVINSVELATQLCLPRRKAVWYDGRTIDFKVFYLNPNFLIIETGHQGLANFLCRVPESKDLLQFKPCHLCPDHSTLPLQY